MVEGEGAGAGEGVVEVVVEGEGAGAGEGVVEGEGAGADEGVVEGEGEGEGEGAAGTNGFVNNWTSWACADSAILLLPKEIKVLSSATLSRLKKAELKLEML